MSSIFMYLAPSVPKSSSPSENNMPKRANRPWSGWWNSTREREKEKNKVVNQLLEGLDNTIAQDLGDGSVIKGLDCGEMRH